VGCFAVVFLRLFLVLVFSVLLVACVEFPSFGGCAVDNDCNRPLVCVAAACVSPADGGAGGSAGAAGSGGSAGAAGMAGSGGQGGTGGTALLDAGRIQSPDATNQPRPMPTDGGAMMQMGDRDVPPMERDAGIVSSADRLGQCVERMTTFLQDTSAAVGCGEFDEAAQMNPNSGYNRDRQTAACLQVSCQGDIFEGHNGIPAQMTCSQLEDWVTVLERALAQAVAGGCPEPRFQVRVISLADFMGGEPCDQITCGIDEQGEPINIDKRN